MMPQMESGDPGRERAGSAYRGYEEQQSSSQPPYEASYRSSSTDGPYNDNFAEAVAQRVAQILNQRQGEKISDKSRGSGRPTAGQRLALAIVSIALLVPIGGVLMGTVGSAGLVGFSIACLFVLLVNVVFNVMSR